MRLMLKTAQLTASEVSSETFTALCKLARHVEESAISYRQCLLRHSHSACRSLLTKQGGCTDGCMQDMHAACGMPFLGFPVTQLTILSRLIEASNAQLVGKHQTSLQWLQLQGSAVGVTRSCRHTHNAGDTLCMREPPGAARRQPVRSNSQNDCVTY